MITNVTNEDDTRNENQLQSRNEASQEQEREEDTMEEQWTQATRRRGRQPARQQAPLTGVGPKDDDLQAADKRAWLFVGRLRTETTPDSIRRFLIKRGIKENVICEELNTRSNLKSFKVGIPFQYLDRANEEEFWPTGIIVRRFRFPRLFREHKGISPE